MCYHLFSVSVARSNGMRVAHLTADLTMPTFQDGHDLRTLTRGGRGSSCGGHQPFLRWVNASRIVLTKGTLR